MKCPVPACSGKIYICPKCKAEGCDHMHCKNCNFKGGFCVSCRAPSNLKKPK